MSFGNASTIVLTCQLYVPDLVPQPPDAAAALSRLPALDRLLQRSHKDHTEAGSFEALLCGAFGVRADDDAPVAALTLLADGADPGDDVWLRADPVHLLINQGELILADSRRLRIDAEEARALVQTLNQHFAADNLELRAGAPARWYLRLHAPAGIQTTPLRAAVGRSIDGLLPRGPQAPTWHRRLNEAQMVLHDHPVNAAREARGELPINSVWLWGGGRMPGCAPASDLQVWTDAPLARGLARCAGAQLHRLPTSADAWLTAAADGMHLLLLGDAEDHFETLADPAQMREMLERNWFAPLMRTLMRGRVGRVHVVTYYAARALRFAVSRADLWKVWRRGLDLPAPALVHA